MVASSLQHGGNADFFSIFSLGGIHSQGILPVIPLELQGKKHQPFSRTQPLFFKPQQIAFNNFKGSVLVCGCFFSTVR